MTDSDRSEQLRLAVAMNGGVSLAIWMGGVALELSRLVRSEDVYGQLRSATHTSVLLDVISGTSAGGINGAFLATSLVHDTSMMSLRSLWLESASLARLLRDPLADKNPPSLLKGDDFFLPELRFAFSRLVEPMRRTPVESQPMDLTLTATQLVGTESKLADDFGTVLADVTHRVRFRFQRGPGHEEDDFSSSHLIDELAKAARSSASFPGAFEPSYVSADGTDSQANPPDMTHLVNSSMAKSGYVVDGGVLDNKPVEAALEAIAAQRVGQRFRRVLFYVVPDPTEISRHVKEGMPGLAEVVWSTLVAIPRNETVVGELREMREKNRRAEEGWVARRVLGGGLSPSDLLTLTGYLFPIYRSTRIDRSTRFVVEQVSQGIARTTGVGLPYRGRRSHLLQAFAAVGGDLPWIPDAAPDDNWTNTGDWTWGARPAVEGLLILSNALAWAETLTGAADSDVTYGDLWDRYFRVRSAETGDSKRWRDAGAALSDLAGGTVESWLEAELQAWAQEPLQTGKLLELSADEIDRRSAMSECAQAAASILKDVAERVRLVTGSGGHSLDPVEDAQMMSLLDLLAPEGQEVLQVLRNLLRFHVVASALGQDPERQAQVIELMQVSATTPDPFGAGNQVDVTKKLAGVQLGHFGAFYKQAWRANDWMRGRLDGCTRIVQLLVNPRALRRSFTSRADAETALRQLADADEGGAHHDIWLSRQPQISRELAFLDDPGSPLPESLPQTCAAVARRMQLDIATEELVVVARACAADRGERKGRDTYSDRFLSDFSTVTLRESPGVEAISREQARELLPLCRIGEERVIPDDVGTDRFASMVTTSLAIASGTVQAPELRLGPLRGVLAITRAPLVLLYLLVANSAEGRAFGVVLTSMALTFGLTVVILDVFIDGLDVIAPIAWVLLVAAVVSLMVRRRFHTLQWILFSFLVVGAIVGVVYLTNLDSLFSWVIPTIMLLGFLLIVGMMRLPRVRKDYVGSSRRP